MTPSKNGGRKQRRTRRPASMKPKLADVAKRAGVSEATASRAINRPEFVRDEVRERIEQAIQELGYVPHGIARALASDRTQSIGIVVPTLRTYIFAEAVEVLQQTLKRAGYHLIIASSDYDQAHEFREVRALLQHGIDGLVLVGHDHLPELRTLLKTSRVPYVSTFNYIKDSEDPCIGLDNHREFYDVTRFLVDLGHRHIAVLTNPTQNNERLAERVAGLQACLADYSLPMPDVVEIPSTLADAREGLRSIVNRNPAITAIACTNDMVAYGVLVECQILGLRVPEDLSVIGFDDLEIAAHSLPSLTTVGLPLAEQSRRVAEFLMARIEGCEVPFATRLEGSLIVRRSTGRPRAAALVPSHRDAEHTPSSKRRARSSFE